MSIIKAGSCELEVDFLNKVIFDTSKSVDVGGGQITIPLIQINGEILDRFRECVDGLWHSENDQLESLHFYTDGTLFCQRKKLKYDFANQQQVYSTYTFTGFTSEQAQELRDKISLLIEAEKVVRIIKVEGHLSKIDDQILFFEKTYIKRMEEKNSILAATDWRVLPDVVESYSGEKDLWITYRQKIRELVLSNPEDYPTPLEFFKAIKTLKWPVDPKIYRDLYPDGLNAAGETVPYLSTEDQFVERDTESSRDLVESRLGHIYSLRQNYINSRRVVAAEVKEMMKLLRLEDFVEAGIDYTKIYTPEEINDMVQ